MMPFRKQILFPLLFLFCFFTTASYAQYIPKHQRNKKSKRITKIEIKARKKLLVTKPVLYCDTLIMHNGSVLKIDSVKSFTLFANHVVIGRKCLITSDGKRGTDGISTRAHGGWGTNAIPLTLYFNFRSLNGLTVSATGGNGGNGAGKHAVPGLFGGGGNVKLHYYAPFVVSFRKRRITRRGDASVFVKNERGYMGRIEHWSAIKRQLIPRFGESAARLRNDIERERYNRRNGKFEFKKHQKPIIFTNTTE